jgi:hypothetical protein
MRAVLDLRCVLLEDPAPGEAIRDVAAIRFSFCLIDRVAEALDFRVPPPELIAMTWPTMRDRGYRS